MSLKGTEMPKVPEARWQRLPAQAEAGASAALGKGIVAQDTLGSPSSSEL